MKNSDAFPFTVTVEKQPVYNRHTGRHIVTVHWAFKPTCDPLGVADGLRASHTAKSADSEELVLMATRCVKDMFAKEYGDDKWLGVWRTCQRYAERELSRQIERTRVSE